jgi:hypothetical protein
MTGTQFLGFAAFPLYRRLRFLGIGGAVFLNNEHLWSLA